MAILALILIFFYGSVSFQSAIIADVALVGYNEVIGQCNFVPENLDIISFNTFIDYLLYAGHHNKYYRKYVNGNLRATVH